MKPPIIYTLLGCTIEIAPGGQSAKASKPGGESREFKGIPGGASAQVQAQRWVHGVSVLPPTERPKLTKEVAERIAKAAKDKQ